MKIPFGIQKIIYQLQAAMPNYDTECPFSKDEPLSFEDRENVKLAFAAIADTHIVKNDCAFKNLNNLAVSQCEASEDAPAEITWGYRLFLSGFAAELPDC